MTSPTRRPPVLRAGPRLAARARAERAERLRHRVRRGAWGTLVLAVVALVGWVVAATPVLGVHTVNLSLSHGQQLTVPQLRAVAAVPQGQPLLRVDTDAVAARLARVDGVASVEVRRSWPTTVRITVVERRPVAAARRGDRWAEVDASGTVFFTRPGQPAGLPVLEVARAGPQDEATRSALQVLVALPQALRQQVVTVQAPTPAGVLLVLSGGQTVDWGAPGETVNRAAAVQALLTRGARVIDVASPGVATTGPG